MSEDKPVVGAATAALADGILYFTDKELTAAVSVALSNSELNDISKEELARLIVGGHRNRLKMEMHEDPAPDRAFHTTETRIRKTVGQLLPGHGMDDKVEAITSEIINDLKTRTASHIDHMTAAGEAILQAAEPELKLAEAAGIRPEKIRVTAGNSRFG